MISATRIALLIGLAGFCCAFTQGQENLRRDISESSSFSRRPPRSSPDESLTQIKTLDDWNLIRPTAKRELLYTLGLDPLPKRTPLKAQITGTLQRTNYRIEKIALQSMPGLYVTGNFYVPQRPAPNAQRLPTILYVCGHSPHPLGAKWDYQDRAIWFAEHGYVCLILDTLESARCRNPSWHP